MATNKAAGIVYIRDQCRKLGKEVELLAVLPARLHTTYKMSLPVSRVDINEISEIYLVAARILYPEKPQPMVQFGYDLATDNLSGIYRFLMPLLTVPMVIRQTAKLYSVYYDKGKSTAAITGEKSVRLVIEDFPEQPATHLDITTGYIKKTIEMTGAKNVRVTCDRSNPNAWRWDATYE
jgi:hypothetical protein